MGPLSATQLGLTHSLRGKTLLIIFVTILGLVGGLYSLSRLVLLRGFNHLEADFARENLDRASSAVSNALAMLDRTTGEYAAWDQTYSFLHGQNSNYTKSEFPAATFAQLRVSFVAVFDNSGREVFSKGFDLARGTEAPVPAGLGEHFRRGSLLLDHRDSKSCVKGILALASGPVLVDSRPVLTSDEHGPIAGTLIMGQVIDSMQIQRLSETTHEPLELDLLHREILLPDVRQAASEISQQKPVVVRVLDKDSLAGYAELNDIYGRPAIILRILLPRQIYQQAQTSLLQFLLLLLAASFVFGAVTLYLLERAVLSRIADLTDGITRIGASGDLSGRLDVAGKDELAYLGVAINAMLEDLERAQAERHEGRMRLGLMVEKMPAVLWTTDTGPRFTSLIGAGLEALGLHTNELVGQSVFQYFHSENPDFPAIAAHQKALEGQPVTYEMEWQKRAFESHVQPLRSSDGEILGVIGVALDITDRKHLTDQLRQSQKMQAVGELAGGVAHDFNNLLMVVKGHAELLLDRLPKTSPLRPSIDQMQKAADRAASLTRQLLAFSRKQVLQPRVLDLNEVVSGMIKMVSRVIGEHIELSFLPCLELGSVMADPSQIEQVLLNLVVNARDAMTGGGRLTIETSNMELDRSLAVRHPGMEPGSYVMLTVSDTGCGMDPRTQSRIFEPFFTTKGQGKGTGLGLATVYGVVKQTGGFIWVYSEVDQGTTFKIYLPLVAAEAEKAVVEKAASGPPPGNETILFVEDEESVRELVRDYLRANGYRVLEAVDGMQALETAAAHKGAIHLLVTDVVMPRLSGRELATRLSSERPGLRVLYISGYTDDSIFRHGVLEGGVAFLQKPFNLKSIAERIREVLDGQTVVSVSPSRRDTV